MFTVKLILQFVDTVAEGYEVAHVENLRSDVEVKTHKLHVCHGLSLTDYGNHVAHGNAELVFGESCGDVGMRVSAHVGVDAESHVGCLPFGCRQLVDNLKLGKALHIEAENVVVETEVYLPVALAHSGIDDARGIEPCLHGSLYLSSADAIHSETCLAYDAQQGRVGVCLHGIVDHEVLVASCLFVDGAQRGAQQISVVVVEWSPYVLELLYRKITFHVFVSVLVVDVIIC